MPILHSAVLSKPTSFQPFWSSLKNALAGWFHDA
jgi:hypothetical protein